MTKRKIIYCCELENFDLNTKKPKKWLIVHILMLAVAETELFLFLCKFALFFISAVLFISTLTDSKSVNVEQIKISRSYKLIDHFIV